MPPEQCLKCFHWNHNRLACDRVFKAKLLIAFGGGDLDIRTQPGLIPEHLESEFEQYLADAIMTAVDSYPGWPEIHRLMKEKGCASKAENKAFKEFGQKVRLLRPVTEI